MINVNNIKCLRTKLEGARARAGLCVDVSSGVMIYMKVIRNAADHNTSFAVRVGAYVRTNTDAACMFIWAMFGW